MIVDIYIECWFNSGVHDNLIMTLNLWKGKDIFKRCGIEKQIEQEQTQRCSFV